LIEPKANRGQNFQKPLVILISIKSAVDRTR